MIIHVTYSPSVQQQLSQLPKVLPNELSASPLYGAPKSNREYIARPTARAQRREAQREAQREAKKAANARTRYGGDNHAE